MVNKDIIRNKQTNKKPNPDVLTNTMPLFLGVSIQMGTQLHTLYREISARISVLCKGISNTQLK